MTAGEEKEAGLQGGERAGNQKCMTAREEKELKLPKWEEEQGTKSVWRHRRKVGGVFKGGIARGRRAGNQMCMTAREDKRTGY